MQSPTLARSAAADSPLHMSGEGPGVRPTLPPTTHLRVMLVLVMASLLLLAGLPSVVWAAPPAGKAMLYLQPPTVSAPVGGTFQVEIVVETGASLIVDGVQVLIRFDPAYLRLDAVLQVGPLTYQLANQVDNGTGSLFYAVGALGASFPSGVFPVARLTFQLHTAPPGTLGVTVPPDPRWMTIVASAGSDVLHESRGLTVTTGATVSSAAQARAAPAAVGAVPIAPVFQSYYDDYDGLRVLGRSLGSAHSRGGLLVQYFEKGRIEDHRADTSLPPEWRQMYGLLVDELMQAGVRQPVGGDASTLTYARLAEHAAAANRIAVPDGFGGGVATLPDGAVFIPFSATLAPAPGHLVPTRFWQYINRADLFPGGWLHDVGLPVTDPIEAVVDKGPVTGRRIIVQAFQRTILTDDPLNPTEWQIERANVGTDYAQSLPERLDS